MELKKINNRIRIRSFCVRAVSVCAGRSRVVVVGVACGKVKVLFVKQKQKKAKKQPEQDERGSFGWTRILFMINLGLVLD